MGPDIPDIRDYDPVNEDRPEWPMLRSYIENGITITVFKAGWAIGAQHDFIVKPVRRTS